MKSNDIKESSNTETSHSDYDFVFVNKEERGSLLQREHYQTNNFIHGTMNMGKVLNQYTTYWSLETARERSKQIELPGT